MTFFQPVENIETRALALPLMSALLSTLADTHEKSLQKSINADRLWHKFNDTYAQQSRHVFPALSAGFIEDVSRGTSGETRLRLTPKGWAVIGRKVPFWMEDEV